MVLSPAFAIEQWGRDAAAFVKEVEVEAVKIIRKYLAKTELTRSWIYGVRMSS
jgi:hypothetical protein